MQTSKETEYNASSSAENLPSQADGSQNRRNKRFQACVSCRATKTKCLPSEQAGSCQSCLKAARPCIMPGPAKPRIKSAQKFSELEKKIEMLTSALAGKQVSPGTSESALKTPNPVTLQTPSASNNSSPDDNDEHMVHNVDFNPTLSPQLTNHHIRAGTDAVEEGILEQETAINLFIHWHANMRPFLPLIFFRPGLDAEQVQKTKPTLFLAVLTIASTSICPSLSTQLVSRLSQELGSQIFVRNVQSTDLVLATLLFAQYYFQPGSVTNLAPSQYMYAAVAMMLDLGLHAQAKSSFINQPGSVNEAARVCITEWYATSAATTLLHRSPLVRYSQEVEKYAQHLQQEYLPSEGWLFCLIKLQQIIENASLLLDAFENKSENAFDETTTQYKINMLQQQLELWGNNVPENVDIRLKQHGLHTAYLTIHAIAVRCFVRKAAIQKQNKDHTKSTQSSGMMGLTPSHFDCLTKCLASIKALFDIYISFEPSLARCLPNSYLMWNVNAAVLLIKLGHFGEMLTKLERPAASSSTPTPQLTFQATIVHYLDAIAAKLDDLSRDGFYQQAKPYIKVLRKLKPYYLQKRNICINPQGDAIVVEADDDDDSHTAGHTLPQSSVTKPGFVRSTSGHMHMQADHELQSTQYGISLHEQYPQSLSSTQSQGVWTPASVVSNSQVRNSPFTEAYGDQFASPSLGMNAAYDPYTYANTDWTALALNPDEVQQLDSYMWADEDTAWIQSLL